MTEPESRGMLQNIERLRAAVLCHAMDPENPPCILPVTKTQSVECIMALQDAGFLEVGENRVQEIVSKYADISTFFAIHMIGQLQTNKIKYIIGRVCLIQSLDRWRLALALDAHARDRGIRLPVLVQVNVGGEAQKAGVAPAEAERFIRDCARLDGIQVCGLMTVMPAVDKAETIRPLFREMRALFERLRAQAIDGVVMRELSMGMSADWQVAAEEGATILRIGSAIFGGRG